MRIKTASNGRKKLSMSKREWLEMGRKAQWVPEPSDPERMDEIEEEKLRPRPKRRFTWDTEFADNYDVPPEILGLVNAGILKDESYGNDIAPKFSVVPVSSEEKGVYLWVDHPDPEMREIESPRFVLAEFDDTEGGDPDLEPIISTDNVAQVVAAVARLIASRK